MVAKMPPGLNLRPSATETALQEAAYAMQGGRAAEAERIAAELLKKTPGDARATHIYCHALCLLGRERDAIILLERTVQQNHNPVLETQLAMLLRQAGRPDDALKLFERAIKSQPAFPPAFLEYGSLLLELIRHNEAVEVLERGLALAPNFAEILMHLGAAYAARGERDKAVRAFASALTTAPNDRDTLFNFAQMMKNSCCFAQAADLFKRLLAIEPGDSASRIGLGICLLENGDAEAGFENLRVACKADAKMFGQVLNALACAGHGRFWLRPSVAEQVLKQKR
jgi:tetratricopeptide (TPR) repeat protein